MNKYDQYFDNINCHNFKIELWYAGAKKFEIKFTFVATKILRITFVATKIPKGTFIATKIFLNGYGHTNKKRNK